MTRVVMLDSGPLGLVINPSDSSEAQACQAWLESIARYAWVVLPEISDYEVRRELIRAKRFAGLHRLDQLKGTVDYQPITTAIMLDAAELWASARQQGLPTADPKALDGDVILAAQARALERFGWDVLVATENVGHLGVFIRAEHWEEIPGV
jgi:predicted nucleic acid-binding protein